MTLEPAVREYVVLFLGMEHTRRGAEKAPTSVGEFQNDWSYGIKLQSRSSLCLHSVHKNVFTVLSIILVWCGKNGSSVT
jgi:hypothetical protein